MTLIATGCSTSKPDSKVSKSEWESAFAYTGKCKISCVYETQIMNWYVDGNLAKEEISSNNETYIGYYSFDGDVWWEYYYDEELEKWEIFEYPHEKNEIESLYSFGRFLDFEDLTYDSTSKSYKAQNITIDYFGWDDMVADSIEYIFSNKKLVRLNAVLNFEGSLTPMNLVFSYKDDFTITLPSVE